MENLTYLNSNDQLSCLLGYYSSPGQHTIASRTSDTISYTLQHPSEFSYSYTETDKGYTEYHYELGKNHDPNHKSPKQIEKEKLEDMYDKNGNPKNRKKLKKQKKRTHQTG